MITLERLKEVVEYFPDNGQFIWKISTNKKIIIGSIAGGLDERGYVRIKIDGKKYRAHRLAFFYMTGRWPIEVDHIDLNCSNNKWNNLRECTRSENCCNIPVKSTNLCGHKGISKNGNKFSVEVAVNGIRNYIGLYNTIEDAIKARDKAATWFHGEFKR